MQVSLRFYVYMSVLNVQYM